MRTDRSRGICAALASALLVLNCSGDEPPAPEVHGVRAHLDMSIGTAFDVEAYPELEPESFVRAGLACGDTMCLVAYRQAVGGVASLYASRVGLDGVALDLPRLRIGPGNDPTVVVARGDEFLLSYLAGPGQWQTVRVRGSDGSIIDGAATPPNVTAGAATASTYLLVSGTSPAQAQLYRGTDLAPVGATAALSLGVPTAVVPGDGQYLLVWPGFAMRIDEQTGASLDSPPIEFSRYRQGPTTGIFQSGVYHLAWPTDDTAYGSRIRASDGVVLDPDDHFNQVSGANLLCDCLPHQQTTFESYFVTVHDVGSELLVTWANNILKRLDGVRVDPSTGERVTADPFNDFSAGTVRTGGPVVVRPDGGVVTDGYSVFGIQRTTSPFALSVNLTSPLRFTSANRSSPDVASDGTDFLVAWVESARIHATRIDGATGAYLDAPPLDLGSGVAVGVASDGTDFMVSWVTPSLGVERRVVRSDGTLGDPLTPPLLPEDSSSDVVDTPEVTFNGKYYLATWYRDYVYGTRRAIYGVRLLPDGSAVDAPPLLLGSNALDRYTVTADATPDPAFRTFVVGWTTSTSIRLRRFRSELGALIDPITAIPSSSAPRLTTDGTTIFLVGATQTFELITASIDPLSGEPIGDVTTHPDGKPASSALRNVFYDGKSYLVGLERANQLYLKRYDPIRNAFDADLDGQAVAQKAIGISVPGWWQLASNGKGRSLLAYVDNDLDRYGHAIKAKLIDNDGVITTSTADGGRPRDGGVDGTIRPGTGDATTRSDAGPNTDGSAAGGSGTAPSDGGASAPDGASPAPDDAAGSTAGAGGMAGTGGATGSGGSGGADSNASDAGTVVAPSQGSSDDGCGCSMARRPPPVSWLSLAALALLLRRRARTYLPMK